MLRYLVSPHRIASVSDEYFSHVDDKTYDYNLSK